MPVHAGGLRPRASLRQAAFESSWLWFEASQLAAIGLIARGMSMENHQSSYFFRFRGNMPWAPTVTPPVFDGRGAEAHLAWCSTVFCVTVAEHAKCAGAPGIQSTCRKQNGGGKQNDSLFPLRAPCVFLGGGKPGCQPACVHRRLPRGKAQGSPLKLTQPQWNSAANTCTCIHHGVRRCETSHTCAKSHTCTQHFSTALCTTPTFLGNSLQRLLCSD